jgi:hypothetical protein
MRAKVGNLELGLNADGSVDEILIYDKDGKCLFHLEQMDEHYYWLRAYGTEKDLVAHIGATIGKVRGEPILGEERQKGKIYAQGLMLKDGKSYEIKGWQEIEGPRVYSDYEWEDRFD